MPQTYEIPNFLGRSPVPVDLIERVISHHHDDSRVTLTCSTLNYKPMMHDYYGTLVETVMDDPTAGQTVSIQLDFWSEDIVRVQYGIGDTVPDNVTPMMVGEFRNDTTIRVTEDDDKITMKTVSMTIEVTKFPFQIKMIDADGNVLWETRAIDIDAFMRPEDQWNPSQQRWIFYHRYAYPMGQTQHTDAQHAFLSLDLHYDEHIYGFGESYGDLDKRETEQVLWIQEGFSNASTATYKRAPFFMSTRGYGMYINTSNAVRCNVGNLEHTALSVIVDDTDFLDFFLINGPSLKDILPRYTSITGKPGLPPKWSFGLWMGRISYNRQDQVETVAQQLREQEIPCDVIHIDTDWYENDWECDLEFGASKFPDPAGMMTTLSEAGFRVCLWQWPNMVVTSDMFHEALEHGYLVTRKNGKAYLFTGFEQDAGFIDYSNPDAVAWVQEKFRKLFELGVAVIKVDFGEGAPPDAVYHGVGSESMHSLYPLLYNKAIYDITQEYHDYGVVWARSAWAGSQRYPVHWSGDGISRYEDLACVLRATLSFGMTGFPFYSHDIGGFSGLPSSDEYIRWAQLGLFASHSRAHGVPPREPWEYGEEANKIFRKYTNLRYQLMPYIYSQSVVCCDTSIPMVRALVLDYQDDPTTYTLDDQYLFGDSILIAPILNAVNRRRVYFPAGDWVDYWTGEVISGPSWKMVDAPLDTMPMYVRSGAIIPFAPLMQYVDEKPTDPLTLKIYHPHDSGQFTIHEEDDTHMMIQYRRDGDQLIVETGATVGQIHIDLIGVTAQSVEASGDPIEISDDGIIIVDGTQPNQVTIQLTEER